MVIGMVVVIVVFVAVDVVEVQVVGWSPGSFCITSFLVGLG